MPTLTLDGRRVHYLDEGAGEPAVLLVHGFPLDAGMWRPQLDALAGSHRLVAPDLYGFGGSDVPPDPGGAPPGAEGDAYSIPGYADQVAGVADALGLGPVVLVGLSMGGYVALDLARRRPELIAALVLADTRAEADSSEARQRRSDQQVFLRARGDVASLADGLADTVVGKATADREALLERVKAMMAANPADGWIGALEAMRTRADATDVLGSIGVPALVVVGEDDTLTPPALSEAMAAAIPGARLEVIPAAGHLSSLENPGAFNRVLSEFLAGL